MRYLWQPTGDSVNAVKTKLFEKKYAKKGKVSDMSLLPPYNSELILHIKRANYVAKVWKSSSTNRLDPGDISENGWLPDGSTYRVDDIFPHDVEETLCDPSFINDDFDEFDEQDQLSDDNYEDYDNNDDEWEYWYRLLSIRLKMFKLNPESPICTSSYYLLDICYHYFDPIFSVFIFFTNYVGFISHELIIIWISGYKKVSNFNPCSFMCIVPWNLKKVFN